MNILALSGWGQPHDALADLLPGAKHLDYTTHASVESLHMGLQNTPAGYDMVVGWSLGGQLAVEALAKGIVTARRLVLIAAPFQFVGNTSSQPGMPRATYEKFRENYERDPQRTMRKSWEFVTHDDRCASHVKTRMTQAKRESVLRQDWGYWLARLGTFSCCDLALDRLPPTLIVHGENDAVVDHRQSELFAARIPHAKLVKWPGCGHAPHWHDEPQLHRLIHHHV